MAQQVASFGQGLAIAGRIAECFPWDIPRDEVQGMIDDLDFWREYLGGAREVYAMRITVPDVDVEFELILNSTTGLAMVECDGYDSAEGWRFRGEEVTKPRAGRFKLVQIGYCRNLDEVLERLASHGRVPEGQWREAFRAKFRKPHGKGPIGVADPSWVDPNGDRFFPCVSNFGNSSFFCTDYDWSGDWRWLVECQPQSGEASK